MSRLFKSKNQISFVHDKEKAQLTLPNSTKAWKALTDETVQTSGKYIYRNSDALESYQFWHCSQDCRERVLAFVQFQVASPVRVWNAGVSSDSIFGRVIIDGGVFSYYYLTGNLMTVEALTCDAGTRRGQKKTCLVKTRLIRQCTKCVALPNEQKAQRTSSGNA